MPNEFLPYASRSTEREMSAAADTRYQALSLNPLNEDAGRFLVISMFANAADAASKAATSGLLAMVTAFLEPVGGVMGVRNSGTAAAGTGSGRSEVEISTAGAEFAEPCTSI